jgi:hypothetical protein
MKAMNMRNLSGGTALRGPATQRGVGRLKAILWTSLFLLLVYVCFKVVPIYFADYQLQDKMLETARYASAFRKPEEEIRDAVFREVQDLEIPAHREDVKIEYNGHTVRITVHYTVPLDLFFYHTEMHFSPSSENRSIL